MISRSHSGAFRLWSISEHLKAGISFCTRIIINQKARVLCWILCLSVIFWALICFLPVDLILKKHFQVHRKKTILKQSHIHPQGAENYLASYKTHHHGQMLGNSTRACRSGWHVSFESCLTCFLGLPDFCMHLNSRIKFISFIHSHQK